MAIEKHLLSICIPNRYISSRSSKKVRYKLTTPHKTPHFREFFVSFVYICEDMSKKECIQGFSDYIFWDVDRSSIDPSTNASFIVQRVLEYGQYADWKHLLAYYGLDSIVNTAKQLRTLESKALSFISTVSRTPIEQFRCYNTRQSIPQHSNF